MTVLAIYVSVFSALPTSHCHCHDRTRSEQQRSECPFGQLRGLAGSFAPAAAIQLIAVLVEWFEILRSTERKVVSFEKAAAFQARAPPPHLLLPPKL
jgi:hypothetical protein